MQGEGAVRSGVRLEGVLPGVQYRVKSMEQCFFCDFPCP